MVVLVSLSVGETSNYVRLINLHFLCLPPSSFVVVVFFLFIFPATPDRPTTTETEKAHLFFRGAGLMSPAAAAMAKAAQRETCFFSRNIALSSRRK